MSTHIPSNTRRFLEWFRHLTDTQQFLCWLALGLAVIIPSLLIYAAYHEVSFSF